MVDCTGDSTIGFGQDLDAWIVFVLFFELVEVGVDFLVGGAVIGDYQFPVA